jgi:dephospho-CoA kinase
VTSEEADNKIKAQMTIREKIAKADIVIDNGGSLEELENLIKSSVIEKVTKQMSLIY